MKKMKQNNDVTKKIDWITIADIDLGEEFPPDNLVIDQSYGDTRLSFFREGHYQAQIIINHTGAVVINEFENN